MMDGGRWHAISAIGAGLTIGLLLLACVGGGGPGGAALDDIEGEGIGARGGAGAFAARLLPAGALPGRHFIRQWVVIRWQEDGQEREQRFEAVLQKEGDVLQLVGLGPMGRVGFRIVLEGERVGFENRSGRPMPFAPAYVLADVQRVFYPWLEAATPCPSGEASGERRGEQLGLEIEEHHVDGTLVERRFAVADQPAFGEVVVRYRRSDEEATAPPGATLRNDWLGYAIEIELLSLEALPSTLFRPCPH